MFGTLDVLSTLDAQASSQTVAKFGEDKVYEQIARALVIHNSLLRDAVGGWARFTTDRLVRYGGNVTGEMQAVDEYGTPDAQKSVTGANMGYPLRQFEYGMQWTRKFFQNSKVTDLTKETNAALQAHSRRVLRELKTAIYKPTNNLTYADELVDAVVLPLRALLNADSTPIPINPYNGTSFTASSHTHYVFATSLTNAVVQSLIDLVQEHGVVGTLQLEIPSAVETAFRALTDFTPQLQASIILGGGSTTTITTGNLEVINTVNRKIGIFKSAEVWVKPYAIGTSSTYWITVRDTGKRPLAIRHREGTSPINLQIAYENENFPLRARVMEDEFGISAYDREGAAVLYVDAGAAAYVAPTIT